MAKTKQTPVKYPLRKYPRGKYPPKPSVNPLIERAQEAAKRHKDHIADLFKKLPRITLPSKQSQKTKTKASLRASLKKKNKLMANLPMLETVAKRKKGYKILLQDPTNDVVTIFCNCARNLLKGNAKLSNAQLSKLAQDKENIRALAQPGKSIASKKAIIKRGGFLPLLAAGALGALAPTLLGGLFGR